MASKKVQGKTKAKKSNSNAILLGVVGLAVLGLLAFGMSSVFQVTKTPPAADNASAAEGVTGGIAITDRETTYLGANSDPTALARAETGASGHPTLVMFHADW